MTPLGEGIRGHQDWGRGQHSASGGGTGGGHGLPWCTAWEGHG